MNVFGDIKLKKPKTIKLDFNSPFELFKNIYRNYESAFLLESMESNNGLSRFSVLGFKPAAILKAKGNILENEKWRKRRNKTENPFSLIKGLKINNINEKEFNADLVGYISYEAAGHFEKLKFQDSIYPDFHFGLFLDSIVFDRTNNKCKYITYGENREEEIIKIGKNLIFYLILDINSKNPIIQKKNTKKW